MTSVIAANLVGVLFWGVGAVDSADGVANAWRTLQTRFDRVRFRYTGTVVIPAGYTVMPRSLSAPEASVGDDVPVPAETQSSPIEGELLLDLAAGRVHIERRDHRPQSASSGNVVMASSYETANFDGRRYEYFRPEKTNPMLKESSRGKMTELWIYDSALQVLFDVPQDPLLLACGAIYFTIRIDPDKLRSEIKAANLRIDNDTVMHKGRRCLVLRTTPDDRQRFYEYWVDAEDPRRIVKFNGYGLQGKGELWLSSEIDYRDTEWGPIPDHWTATKYSFQTDKPLNYEVRLEDFEANPTVTDADFQIDAPVGTRVYDATRPKGDQYYVVAAAGQPALPVGEFMLQQEEARSRNWLYLGLLGVAALVVAAVIVIRRREA